MKKAKILAVFGILLAMGITACNKGGESGDVQSQETPASQQQGGDTSAEHKHSFGKWTETKAPTCTEKGAEERVCECGEKETREKDALGHDFKNGTVTADTSTCDADGKQTIKCSRCNETQQVDVKAHHRYGDEADVAKKGDGYVGYKKAECSVDHAIQIKIRALDGTLASGSSIKSGTADGYFKLSSNGHSISWKFDYQPSSGKTGAIGMAYTRGFMDAWNSNSSKAYGVYSTSSSSTRPAGNFDFTVNGNLVDKSAYEKKTFAELTKGGEDSSSVGDDYSPIALIPVGEVVLNSGDNTIVYKRTGSYNFVISDIVLVVKEFAHEHTAGTAWESDENNHWHVCTAPGCPVEGGYQMEKAAHTWGEQYDVVDAKCNAKGSYKQKCTVCDFVKTVETDKIAHTYPNDGAYTKVDDPTCDKEGHEKRTCSVCEEDDIKVIPALGHNFGEAVANYAAVTEGEGQHIAATAHNCANCDKSALQWSALDYDATESAAVSDDGKAPKSQDSGKAVQIDTSTVQGGGENHDQKGCHLVYIVDIPEAVENATVAMLATEAPYRADMFDAMTNENSKGYIQNDAGEWVRPDSRYGIKVDGQEYMVAKNNGAVKGGGTTWYQFPGISLTLTKGIHKFDFFKYGGYDVNHYAFRLMGLSHVTPTHTHNGDAEWKTDAANHWHVCTGEGCPIPEADGGVYDKGAHDKLGVPTNADVPATCLEEGKDYWKCSVCGYESFDVVAKLAHKDTVSMVKVNADGKKVTLSECSVGNEKAITMESKDISGAKAFSRTSADLVEPEVFALGADKTVNGAASYKLDKGTAIFWKINVDKPITGAKLEIGAKYSNSGSRCFGNHHDYSSSNTNGDKDSETEWRIYASVDGVNFLHPNYEKATLINSKLDSNGGKFADFGTVDLVAGENLIYAVQPNIGYRIEFTGGIRISYTGDAVITGEEPAHEHAWTAGTADAKGISALTCSGCTNTGLEFNGMADNAIGSNAGVVSGGKLNKESTMSWTVDMPKAGTVEIWLSAKYSSGNGDKAFASGWAVKVGDVDGILTLDTTARADSLLKQDSYVWFKIGEVTITEAGEAVIKVTTYANSAQARLLVDNAANNARLIYK